MQESDSTPDFRAYDEPAWLTTDDDEVARVRDPLVGDYNMWVNLAGGNREIARQLLIKDFPRGPLEGGSDENLRGYLGQRFPWLWAYIAFQYRAGIFNTITFLIMLAGLVYIALVYVPRDERNKQPKPTGAVPVAVVRRA